MPTMCTYNEIFTGYFPRIRRLNPQVGVPAVGLWHSKSTQQLRISGGSRDDSLDTGDDILGSSKADRYRSFEIPVLYRRRRGTSQLIAHQTSKASLKIRTLDLRNTRLTCPTFRIFSSIDYKEEFNLSPTTSIIEPDAFDIVGPI